MSTPSAARVAEFTYAVLLAPPPLRRLANGAIRALLPEAVSRGPATVVLNPRDPVVSGALALSVYEPLEQAFLESRCSEGTLFVDVGANVGLYAALAAHYVGEAGHVVAFEPDPVSLVYLERTIARNHPDRVTLHRLAATSTAGERTLYVSTANRGDNRLVPHAGARESLQVQGCPLDDVVQDAHLATRHLFLKIDVQGAEGEVIEGACHLLRSAQAVTLMMEFWPEGLGKAGTDPAGLLESLKAMGLSLYELVDGPALSPIVDTEAFSAQYEGRRYTNIIGLRSSRDRAA